ncbi:hypothetical protein PIB30_112831, partial [Stylosanthes scabra]|nr:hypothetical protein [Stylosanthes scabra]
ISRKVDKTTRKREREYKGSERGLGEQIGKQRRREREQIGYEVRGHRATATVEVMLKKEVGRRSGRLREPDRSLNR